MKTNKNFSRLIVIISNIISVLTLTERIFPLGKIYVLPQYSNKPVISVAVDTFDLRGTSLVFLVRVRNGLCAWGSEYTQIAEDIHRIFFKHTFGHIYIPIIIRIFQEYLEYLYTYRIIPGIFAKNIIKIFIFKYSCNIRNNTNIPGLFREEYSRIIQRRIFQDYSEKNIPGLFRKEYSRIIHKKIMHYPYFAG